MTSAARSGQVLDQNGIPVQGASVYVYDAYENIASITSDGTTSIPNPLTTDQFGNYSYQAIVAYYREDIWFNGQKRWSENNVALGSPGADLNLRSDLVANGGFDLVNRYHDETGAYIDRSAKITFNRSTSAPAGLIPTYWSLHTGQGNNSTFIGVSGGYHKSRDDPAIVSSSQRGVLYGWQFSVEPHWARYNSPYDDTVCIGLLNEGTAQASECLYAGRTSRTFSGTGYVSGTTLTIVSVSSGTLFHNTIISGPGIPANTKITAAPDSGGVGTYSVNSSFTAGSSGSPIAVSGITRDFSTILGADASADYFIYATGDYDYIVDASKVGFAATVRQSVVRAPNNVKISVYRNAAGTADYNAVSSNGDDTLTIGDPSSTAVKVATLLKPLAGLSVVAGTLGYGVGAGGSNTQLTSKSTAVVVNAVCGQLTMNNAALAAGAVVYFALNNSFVAADDNVDIWIKSGNATPGTYRCWSEGNGSGGRTIVLQNISGGSLSEAIVLGFGVNKRAIT